MKTIIIENVEIIYNESDLRFGSLYLDTENKIIIPGGIFGDAFIVIKKYAQIVFLRLITHDSASFNGWNIYQVGIDEPYYNIPEETYIAEYATLYPINDTLLLYIKEKINGFTNKIDRSYFYTSKIIEKGRVWNSLNEAIAGDSCFDYRMAKAVPNCEEYVKKEVERQMNIEDYGD